MIKWIILLIPVVVWLISYMVQAMQKEPPPPERQPFPPPQPPADPTAASASPKPVLLTPAPADSAFYEEVRRRREEEARRRAAAAPTVPTVLTVAPSRPPAMQPIARPVEQRPSRPPVHRTTLPQRQESNATSGPATVQAQQPETIAPVVTTSPHAPVARLLQQMLAQPDSLRAAFVLQEIVGPPLSRRPRRGQ